MHPFEIGGVDRPEKDGASRNEESNIVSSTSGIGMTSAGSTSKVDEIDFRKNSARINDLQDPQDGKQPASKGGYEAPHGEKIALKSSDNLVRAFSQTLDSPNIRKDEYDDDTHSKDDDVDLERAQDMAVLGVEDLPEGHAFHWNWPRLISAASAAARRPTSSSSSSKSSSSTTAATAATAATTKAAKAAKATSDTHAAPGAASQVRVTGVTPLPRAKCDSPEAETPLRTLIGRVCRNVLSLNMYAMLLTAVCSLSIPWRWAFDRYAGPRVKDTPVTEQFEAHDRGSARQAMAWVDSALVSGLTCGFPVLVLAGIYGWRRYGHVVSLGYPLLVFAVAAYVLLFYVVLVVATKGKFIPFTGISNVPVFVLFAFSTLLFARTARTLSGLRSLPRRITVAYMGLLVASFAYVWILPRLWFSAGMTDAMRIVLRLLVHPFVWEGANYLVRSMLRGTDFRVDPSRLVYALLPGMTLNAMYGRLLVSVQSSTTLTVVLSLLLSFIEIFLRVSVGARDRTMYRLSHSRAETKRRFLTAQAARIRADIVCVEQLVEVASIVYAGALAYVFDMSVDGSGLSLTRVVTDIVLQLAIEFVTDVVVVLLEVRVAKVPILLAWETRHGGKRAPWFWYSAVIVSVITFYFATLITLNGTGWIAVRDAASGST